MLEPPPGQWSRHLPAAPRSHGGSATWWPQSRWYDEWPSADGQSASEQHSRSSWHSRRRSQDREDHADSQTRHRQGMRRSLEHSSARRCTQNSRDRAPPRSFRRQRQRARSKRSDRSRTRTRSCSRLALFSAARRAEKEVEELRARNDELQERLALSEEFNEKFRAEQSDASLLLSQLLSKIESENAAVAQQRARPLDIQCTEEQLEAAWFLTACSFGALCCPITQEVMNDPVMCTDGQTYERSAIQRHLERSLISPVNRLPINDRMLIPNRALRKILEDLDKRAATNSTYSEPTVEPPDWQLTESRVKLPDYVDEAIQEQFQEQFTRILQERFPPELAETSVPRS